MSRAPEKSSRWLFQWPDARRAQRKPKGERPVTNAEMRLNLSAMLKWPGGPTLKQYADETTISLAFLKRIMRYGNEIPGPIRSAKGAILMTTDPPLRRLTRASKKAVHE